MLPGSALPLALAVQADPSRVEAARQATLPVDIGRLLQLLSGHPERLRKAAEETGVDSERLLEAARFYAREAMLHADSGDARLLGLGPGAGADDLKRNYRALQAWLHPDREGAPADAQVLSARVNVAWSRLRDMKAFQDRVVKSGELRPRWRRIEEPVPRSTAARLGSIAGAGAVVVVLVMLTWRAAVGPLPGSALPPPRPLPPAQVRAPAATDNLTRPALVDRAEPGPAAAAPAVDATAMAPSDPMEVEAGSPGVSEGAPLALPAVRPVVAVPVATATATRSAPPPPRSVAAAQARPDAAATAVAVLYAAPAGARPTPPGTAAAPVQDLDPEAVRNAQARMHADSLYNYLVRPGEAAPPIWHSGAALDQAARARRVLAGGGAHARLRREQAVWWFDGDQAELQVPVDPAGPTVERRMLRAQWQWKQGAWWVTRVALEES